MSTISSSHRSGNDGYLELLKCETTQTSLTIPTTIVDGDGNTHYLLEIGSGAFQGNQALQYVYFEHPENSDILDVDAIGDYAFADCPNLLSVELPSSLKAIDIYAFKGCKKLYMAGIMTNGMFIPEGVEYIGSHAFEGCESMKILILPNSLTTLEDGAFYGCTNLQDVTIGTGLEAIPEDAFSGCKGLATNGIELPSTIKRIGSSAFDGTYIPSITIPEGVEYIGQNAFLFTKISSLTIPASVTSIGGNIISLDRNLTTIKVAEGNKHTKYKGAFHWGCPLKIPKDWYLT